MHYQNDFCITLKNDFKSVRYLHVFYQPMDDKIKTWTLRFPAKENPNMEKALFNCQSCCSTVIARV